MSNPSIPTSAKKLTDRVRKVRKTLEKENVNLSLPQAQKTAAILFGTPSYDVLAAAVKEPSSQKISEAGNKGTASGLTKAQEALSFAANQILYDIQTMHDMEELREGELLNEALMDALSRFMDRKVAENDYIFYADIIAARDFARGDIDKDFTGHTNCLSELAGMAAGILKATVLETIILWFSGEDARHGDMVDERFQEVVKMLGGGDVDGAINLFNASPDLIFSTDDEGWTLLTYATSYNKPKMVKVLIDAGCPINHQDYEGWTALNEGAQIGALEAMKVLLEAGADPNISTHMGWQPYGTAATHGHQKVAELLEKHGASPIAGNAALDGHDLGKFLKGIMKRVEDES